MCGMRFFAIACLLREGDFLFIGQTRARPSTTVTRVRRPCTEMSSTVPRTPFLAVRRDRIGVLVEGACETETPLWPALHLATRGLRRVIDETVEHDS